VSQPLRVIDEIQADLEAIENNVGLYEETNFEGRVEAIEFIEINITDRIEGLLQTIQPLENLIPLQQAAERVKRHLEAVDETLFQRLRADIRRGDCTGTALKRLIDDYVGSAASGRQDEEPGYDNLDLFINGLLLSRPVPPETKAREAEMVYYQPTPARIIMELVEQAQLTQEDVFYDVGSGLGQVSILVHLLSGATAKGIEFEPAYCDYARACAADLNLSRVAFINADARTADYTAGSVFFMYTPFEGSILQEVLATLREESRRRRISLFTYGPCTPQVARQSWLRRIDPHGDHLYKLGVFSTI
jgi:SAM-dependent methyltransferase